MKVLHVASSYPLTPVDSTAPFMAEMLEAGVKRGQQVTVIVPFVDGLEEGTRNGVNVVGARYAPRRLQTWGYGRSLNERGVRVSAVAMTAPAMASMAWNLARRIRILQPDIVHLHWLLPQGALWKLVPRSTPIIVSVHGADLRMARGRLRPLAARILGRADAVIVASSEMLGHIEAISPAAIEKCRVVPHGANSSIFGQLSQDEARARLSLEPGLRMILAVGRLVSKKGFSNLIASMGNVAEDIELFIIGDGPERESLEKQAREAGHEQIHFMGWRNRTSLPIWFSACDLVAVTGIRDGFDVDSGPVVLVEALASGKAIVATPIGMARDVISNGVNGILVENESPEALANAISLGLSRSSALGREAFRTFGQIGDWSSVARKVEDLYAETLPKRRPGNF